jgi:hypothetical protein
MNVSGVSGDEGLRAPIVWLLTVIDDVAANVGTNGGLHRRDQVIVDADYVACGNVKGKRARRR